MHHDAMHKPLFIKQKNCSFLMIAHTLQAEVSLLHDLGSRKR